MGTWSYVEQLPNRNAVKELLSRYLYVDSVKIYQYKLPSKEYMVLVTTRNERDLLPTPEEYMNRLACYTA